MSIKQLTRKTKLTDVGKLKYSFNMNYKIIRSKLFLEKNALFSKILDIKFNQPKIIF